MRFDTPLRATHDERAAAAVRGTTAETAAARPGAATGERSAEAVEYITYGPRDEAGEAQCEVPAAFGELPLEYAAIRRGAGVMDRPDRGVVELTGADRVDLLDRLVTQACGDLKAGGVREAFLLERTGRIVADLLVVELGDRMLLDVDVHVQDRVAAMMADFVFAEDVEVRSATDDWYRLSVHGPQAPGVLRALTAPIEVGVDEGTSARIVVDGVEVVVVGRDQTGEPGLELFVRRTPMKGHERSGEDGVRTVWSRLLDTGAASADDAPVVRPVGWFAWNIARVEHGTPVFHVDFGPDALPAETGLLERRVSFTKGCYPGQEVVARMHNLGRPKRTLVGLRIEEDEALPVAGGQVFAAGEASGAGDAATMDTPVGTVTSSTPSPMLGLRPAVLAMVKIKHADPGARLVVNADGGQVAATVGPLRSWPPVEDDVAVADADEGTDA